MGPRLVGYDGRSARPDHSRSERVVGSTDYSGAARSAVCISYSWCRHWADDIRYQPDVAAMGTDVELSRDAATSTLTYRNHQADGSAHKSSSRLQALRNFGI